MVEEIITVKGKQPWPIRARKCCLRKRASRPGSFGITSCFCAISSAHSKPLIAQSLEFYWYCDIINPLDTNIHSFPVFISIVTSCGVVVVIDFAMGKLWGRSITEDSPYVIHLKACLYRRAYWLWIWWMGRNQSYRRNKGHAIIVCSCCLRHIQGSPRCPAIKTRSKISFSFPWSISTLNSKLGTSYKPLLPWAIFPKEEPRLSKQNEFRKHQHWCYQH